MRTLQFFHGFGERLQCFGFSTSQTADEMSFNLNPATDLNLSLSISAHAVGRRNEGHEIPDLRAKESSTRLGNVVLAWTLVRLSKFSCADHTQFASHRCLLSNTE